MVCSPNETGILADGPNKGDTLLRKIDKEEEGDIDGKMVGKAWKSPMG